jgi:cell division protein FtsW
MSSGHSNSIDYGFFLIAILILTIGMFVIASAGGPSGYAEFGDTYYFLKHQIIFGLLPGIAAMVFFSRLPYQWWRRWAWELLLISVVLLVLVFIPGISSEFGTSHSWISFGGIFSIQPSEIAKLTFLFYLAAWMERRGSGVRDVSTGLMPFLMILGLVMFLMLLQPDMGTMTVMIAMSLAVYFSAGASWHHLSIILSGGITLFCILIAVAPYRLERLTAFLNPDRDPLGIGYHISQSLLAIGSGGMFGLGYGHSIQKFQYLPEAVGDSIFAVVAEELGFVFTVPIIILFALLFFRGMKIAAGARDEFGKYIVIGVVSWITFQAVINIGSVLGVMPMTGVPLPLISYGGTSLAISMGAIGVVLNVSKYCRG